jgi:hypothetical protein
MIMVCCGTGFFGAVSFGATGAFSVLAGSFIRAAAGFSSGTARGIFSSVTGDSAGGGAFCAGAVSGAGGTGAAAGTGLSSAFTVSAGGDADAVSGAGGTGCAAGISGVPQDSQNFALGATGAPHCGQAGVASILAPHDSQNFIPGFNGLPHFWQVS